jgi:hypothetical protein
MQPVKQTIPHSVYHPLSPGVLMELRGITDIASRITLLQVPPHFRAMIFSTVHGVDSILYISTFN